MQLHCIGTVEAAGTFMSLGVILSCLSLADFQNCGKALQMRWFIEHSRDWQLLEGIREGLSQVHVYVCDNQLAVFDHPVDVRFHASSALLPCSYLV